MQGSLSRRMVATPQALEIVDALQKVVGTSPTNQQRFQIVDALQKILSLDHCTRKSSTSFQLTLAKPQLPSNPWLARKL
jgi:hypothetical protein